MVSEENYGDGALACDRTAEGVRMAMGKQKRVAEFN
jgi:hypothetical protein